MVKGIPEGLDPDAERDWLLESDPIYLYDRYIAAEARANAAETEVYALLPVKQVWVDAKNRAQRAELILSRIDEYVDFRITDRVHKALLKALLEGKKVM